MLSAKELHEIFTKEGGLPAKGGQKDYCPDDSWLYKTKLQKFYEERQNLLKEERVRVLGSLIQGEWLPNEGRVKLEKQGKFAKSMGYAENGSFYLLPEEAMFLLDQGVVQVQFGDIPVSIQEALTLFLKPEVSLEQYQVFAYFTRLGYILRRYSGPTTYEDQIGLAQFKKSASHKRKMKEESASQSEGTMDTVLKKPKVGSDEHFNHEQTKSDGLENKTGNEEDMDTAELVYKDNANKLNVEAESSMNTSNQSQETEETTEELEDLNKSKVICVDCGKVTVRSALADVHGIRNGGTSIKCMGCGSEHMKYDSIIQGSGFDDNDTNEQIEEIDTDDEAAFQSFPYSSWDFEELNFPDLSTVHSRELKFQLKSDAYLPEGLHLCMRDYSIDVSRYKLSGGGKQEQPEFSHGAEGMSSHFTAKNWSEYKSQMFSTSEEDLLLTSPAAHLWRGDVTPLVKPQHATSTRDILDRLKVIKNSQFIETRAGLSHSEKDGALPQIVYDGYLPSSKFKKTKPGLPHFRLVITSERCPVPNLYTLSSVRANTSDNIPLYWAVVECGDVIFFSFNHVDLPQEITIG